ncbi:MAG TPA: S-methyl-5-thioribose-1-phosphate isomerase [Streptosporangiaceae bacterium]|nr:S-methyl-5-thioribose-1-phosphate isomerase [Streptosporangiaceae bacterium]
MDSPDVLAWRDGHIEALDQTALPHTVRTLRIGTVDELVDAITSLAIRGAPVLGAAGALGVALAVGQGSRERWDGPRLTAEIGRIAAARPTAVNLGREVAAVAARIGEGPVVRWQAAVQDAALAVLESTAATSLRISARGAAYLREACGAGPLRVHTHCNTGALACLGWGTALGVIRALHEAGALRHVIVDETRPLLQGARLTCWELAQLGIEHQLACDGAAPFLISQGRADAVVVGADRIAANGDVANKIGTYSLALAARQAGIPFVVAAPESTIDPATASGADIPIEQRADEEVTVPAAPAGTRAVNLAFDVTPAALVSAIVTEERVVPGGRGLSGLGRALSGRRRALQAELGLAWGEAARLVEPDRRAGRVGHDDERAGAQDLAAVPGCGPDQGPGQALAAGQRVGLDVLVPGAAVARVEQPELGPQPAIGKGAEPGALTGPGHALARHRPPLQELGLVAAEAADGQLDGLPPVGVVRQRPDLGGGAGAGRGVRLGGGQHGGVLDAETGGREVRRDRDVRGGVHAERDVRGARELRGEPGQPRACFTRPGHPGQQQEVAPPEAGVARAADDQVVAAVADLGALQDAQRHVGPEGERGDHR